MSDQMIIGAAKATPSRSALCSVSGARCGPRWLPAFLGGDRGMSTAEYAIGTVAAAAFAALLYTVLTGGSVTTGLTSLIERALETSF
jgi:hypothetical protein